MRETQKGLASDTLPFRLPGFTFGINCWGGARITNHWITERGTCGGHTWACQDLSAVDIFSIAAATWRLAAVQLWQPVRGRFGYLSIRRVLACVRASAIFTARRVRSVDSVDWLPSNDLAGRACFIHVAGVIDETDSERYGTERAALCTVQRATATTATGVVVNGHADVGVAGRRDRRARRAGRRRDERQRCIDHALPTERNWVAASEWQTLTRETTFCLLAHLPDWLTCLPRSRCTGIDEYAAVCRPYVNKREWYRWCEQFWNASQN